ncbi:neural cell adhesion molecule 2-like isoform X2 [Brevipalpus obovatus]|uniref:neural cell adhesion molecule 2-like isoform X2 n=1 Tax=Brevipalpus obovatus TaxID=246614 RepID=UPI003D9EF8D0
MIMLCPSVHPFDNIYYYHHPPTSNNGIFISVNDCVSKWTKLLLIIYTFLIVTISVENNLIIAQLEPDTRVHQEVESIAGSDSQLPCDFKAHSSDQIALILWYKGSAGIPIYTLDARNTSSLARSQHSPAPSYRDRAFLDIKRESIQLHLLRVRMDDAGEYRCRIDFHKSPTEDYLVNLTVIEPPVSVTLWNLGSNEKIEGLTGPYNEGSNLSVRCSVIGGSPRPWIVWLKGTKNMVTMNSVVHNISAKETISDVFLSNLSRSDLMVKLTCKTSNSKLGQALETSIFLNINLKPSEINFKWSKMPIIGGHRTELTCIASGSRPPAKISWWLQGRRLNRARETISSDGNETLSVLPMTFSHRDHGKELTCHAENNGMNNASLEAKISLNIHYSPLTRIVLGDKIDGNSIREGSDVYFECIVDANPWVIEVNWLFDGSPLSSSSSSGIIISNQSLVLQKVKRHNRGLYSCAATNYLGVGRSDTFYLKVLYSPVCRPGQTLRYGVAPNESINITCQVDADPEDVSFNWLLNNSRETIKIRHFSQNGSQSVALYTPRYSDGYGKLLCFGSNRVGDQHEPCVFSIFLASPPEPVAGCRVTNQTMDSLYVSCKPGDSGGLKQIFFLEVYNSLMQKLHWSTASEIPSFHIQSLPPSTRLDLNIYAENKKGRSPSYSLSTYTLNVPRKEAKKFDQFNYVENSSQRYSSSSLTTEKLAKASNLIRIEESNEGAIKQTFGLDSSHMNPLGFQTRTYCHKDFMSNDEALEYAELSLMPRETWDESHSIGHTVGSTEYASIDFHLTKARIGNQFSKDSQSPKTTANLLAATSDFTCSDPVRNANFVQTPLFDDQIDIH